jgi:putative phosphoribosyl transferase
MTNDREHEQEHESEMNEVQIQAGCAILFGSLIVPESTDALVLFAHGSGSSRHSPRNQFVAHVERCGGDLPCAGAYL